MFLEKLVDVLRACEVDWVLGWLLRTRLELTLLTEVSAFGV